MANNTTLTPETMKLFTNKNLNKIYDICESYVKDNYPNEKFTYERDTWGTILLHFYLARKQNGKEETMEEYIKDFIDGMHEEEFFANAFNNLYREMFNDKIRRMLKIHKTTDVVS